MLTDRAEFQPSAANVAMARRFVFAALVGVACSELTIDNAVLIVSELASNAVQHARTPFVVTWAQTDHTITIEVADFSAALPVQRQAADEHGRGLQIVANLADEWGVRPEAVGKAVFVRLSI